MTGTPQENKALMRGSIAYFGAYTIDGSRITRIPSTTDPDARLFRKGAGKEAKLCHMGHLMTENRNGLIVDARLTEANGAIAVILPNNDSVVLCAQRISGGPLLIAYC